MSIIMRSLLPLRISDSDRVGGFIFSWASRENFPLFFCVPFSFSHRFKINFHWLIFRYMSCLLFFPFSWMARRGEEGNASWGFLGERRGKCFDGLKYLKVVERSSGKKLFDFCKSFLSTESESSTRWKFKEHSWLTIFPDFLISLSLSRFAASIFPSSLGYSNWGSPTNLYPPHSMSHVTSSHVSPHLGSYSHHYAWPPHTPAAQQVDNFELYKKLSPYE